jgi:hypothetical protein
MSAATPLSNIQQELLKLYSSDITEADLLHLKRYLGRYFAFKAIGEADEVLDIAPIIDDLLAKTKKTSSQWK